MTRLEVWGATGEAPTEVRSDVELAEAMALVDRLDGSGTTQLWVTGDSGTQLGIAGGPDVFFVGFVSVDGAIHECRSRRPREEGRSVVVGGQPTWLDPAQLVHRDEAAEAVQAFLTDETRSKSLDWVAG